MIALPLAYAVLAVPAADSWDTRGMEARTLACPRDATILTAERVEGIDADRCPSCLGLWLDHDELDALEARRADEEARRGTVVFAERPSELPCPICGQPMHAFNYRAYNLELETCADHGFWLDAGENRRVLDVIEQRRRDLRRVPGAEAAWRAARRGGGGGMMDRVRRFLGR